MNAPALPVHPRAGESALGFRRDGGPIWPIKGGSGKGGDPSAPPAPSGEQGSHLPNTDRGTPPAPPAADPTNGQQLVTAQQQAPEAAEQRDQLQAALEPVNKALNPDGAEAGQDPAKLAAYRAAGEQGPRADRLLNSRSFVPAISELDLVEETACSALRTMLRLRAPPTCTARPRPDRRAAAPSATTPRRASAAPLPCATPSPPGSALDPLKFISLGVLRTQPSAIARSISSCAFARRARATGRSSPGRARVDRRCRLTAIGGREVVVDHQDHPARHHERPVLDKQVRSRGEGGGRRARTAV
ncbi:hypothetical protein GCM10010279_50840 [Streptomyces mutabilis]|nr:hypothetical protein GCM10010279_50840 [Streptomyces mutabilis]